MNAQLKKFSIPHAAIITLVFIVMLIWTWLNWPDPITDFGRELYVPWQITQGKVLYRDIAYFNGPLSPYFNAMVFEILGVSLRSIVIVNLLLLSLLVWMIWRLLRTIADEFTATVACILLLTCFAFLWTNYNFLTPYSHEIAHGIVLSFAAILCLSSYLKNRRAIALVAVGLLLGLIFLTKIEVFAAAFAAIVVGVILAKPQAKAIAGFAAAAIAPPMIAMISFGRDALGSWNYIFNHQVTGLAFYRKIFGTWDRSIFIAFGCYIGLTGLVFFADGLPRKKYTVISILPVGTLIAAAAFMTLDLNVWQQSLRGLTILSPLLAVFMFIRAFRSSKMIVPAVLSIFACGLLAKIFLNVVSNQYGFALAMPAALVAVAALMNVRPDWNARAVILPAIGLLIFAHLFAYVKLETPKPTRVASGADEFRADPPRLGPRGAAVNRMLQILSQLPPQATLAVLPEGVMINYLSRRPNSTPYFTLMPPEVLMFGENRITAAYAAHPPDYIVLLNSKLSDPSEYGYSSFQDYAPQLNRWISANYAEVDRGQTADFPLKLWRRKT